MLSKADAEQLIALESLKKAKHDLESAQKKMTKIHLGNSLDVAHKTNATINHIAHAIGEVREILESFEQ